MMLYMSALCYTPTELSFRSSDVYHAQPASCVPFIALTVVWVTIASGHDFWGTAK
jgi:hypothetical protein